MSTTATVPQAPITLAEFERMRETALFTDDDIRALRQSKDILAEQTGAILDVWYGFVGSKEFLLDFFRRQSDGQPDTQYLGAVRERFEKWIVDTAEANYDQTWLDYQFEIGRRHHRTAKNRTDGVQATENIAFRYLHPLIYPVTATLKPFLAKKGASAEQVEAMHQAWLKSVLLQVTLWSHPYIREGDF
jgi:hypothetical protein